MAKKPMKPALVSETAPAALDAASAPPAQPTRLEDLPIDQQVEALKNELRRMQAMLQVAQMQRNNEADANMRLIAENSNLMAQIEAMKKQVAA